MSKENMQSAPPRPTQGAAVASFTEFWERFSFYILVGLLPLFLSAPAVEKGFGWDNADAVALSGLFTGLAFAAPAVGGWLTSRLLGERGAIIAGALLLIGGQGALTASLSMDVNLEVARIALLYAGLALAIIGIGLIKPAVSAIVGMLFGPDDPRRAAAYGLFMTGVWLGAFFSNFAAGALGEKLGWAYGCLAAAVGMAVGLVTFLALQKNAYGGTGLKVTKTESSGALMKGWSKDDWTRMRALMIMSIFTIIYAVAFYQKLGLLTLVVRDDVNRSIGDFEIPVTWFLSISTGAFVICAPLVAWLVDSRGRVVDACAKQIVGLLVLAVGYGILLMAFQFTPPDQKVSAIWFVFSYSCFGIADVFIWPPQIAIASAAAPKKSDSLVIGAWYVTVGVGSYAAGLIGAELEGLPLNYLLFGAPALLVTSSIALWRLRPWILMKLAVGRS